MRDWDQIPIEKYRNSLDINNIGDGRGDGKERRGMQRTEQNGTHKTQSQENHILCLSSTSYPCGPLPLITVTIQQILLVAAVAPGEESVTLSDFFLSCVIDNRK